MLTSCGLVGNLLYPRLSLMYDQILLEQRKFRKSTGISATILHPDAIFTNSDEPSMIPTLPELTLGDEDALSNGSCLIRQSSSGGSGTGYAVVDVKSEGKVVFTVLRDLENYPKLIKAIRGVKIEDDPNNTKNQVRAMFVVGRFQLHCPLIHSFFVHDKSFVIRFRKDPAYQKSWNSFSVREIEGNWVIQDKSDSITKKSRVWFQCKILLPWWIPYWITDHIAARAIPKVTDWIKPYFQRLEDGKL